MNAPMKWLKDYVDITCDMKTFADAMTMSGTKVECYEALGESITHVVVGKILAIEKHPDADKLVITSVDIGEDAPLQIVTGAKNISTGDLVPVALVGANLAGGLKIKKGKLRGVESLGMMCSVEELGLEKDHYPEAPEDGIYIFEKEYQPGTDVKPIFGLDDVMVEYEITSNRPDCNSILGIAREAAATFNQPFKYPDIKVKGSGGQADTYASVEILEPQLCKRYAARIVKNVKIEQSPEWLRQKLISCGIRPINNIVDITNFVMLEMAQPLHAFDLEKVKENKICVRCANEGETLVTLDGEERTLDPSVLVIADAEDAVAIAGIMGGESTKVTDCTMTLLLESANFDGTNVRMSSKKLGLRTDASSKFEKYLDPSNVEQGLNRACQLIEQLGAGEVISGMVDCYPVKREEKEVSYTVEGINKLLGTDISEDEMIQIFERVELKVDREHHRVTVPTFRPDIEREADLAEEVARFYGYSNIPTTLAAGTPTVGKLNYQQKIESITKAMMESCGLYEAMTYSFESPKVFDKLNIPKEDSLRETVKILNPLGEDFSMMRTLTINGMLVSLATNYNRRNETAKLYELSYVYLPQEGQELPDERLKLTIGMYDKDMDFFTIKGVLEVLFEKLGILEDVVTAPDVNYKWLHPGRQATLSYKDTSLGWIGEVHPDVADNYDLDTRAYLAVIDMQHLTQAANLKKTYQALAKYPAVNRDLALIAKDDILIGQIEAIIKQRGGKILEAYQLFDVYKGKQIEKGYKSIAYSLTFRAKDRTLEENEINKATNKILNGLERELGVTLRQ